MYGARLPDGLRANEKLPETLITPTTKAFHGGHDEPLTPDDILSRGLLTAAQWEEVCASALALFARGRDMARERGLILVDTKYEFGVDGAGRIVIADAIPTDRKSVVQGKSLAVRVELGGRRIIQKNKKPRIYEAYFLSYYFSFFLYILQK